jgi:hypothetical protein
VLTRELRGRPDPSTLRAALRKDLNQGREKNDLSAEESRAIAWVKRASLPVSALNDDEIVTEVLDALARRLDGKAAAPDYYARRFRVTRTCLSYAVRKKRLPRNPLLAANLPGDWTPPKADDAVDPRSVGSPQLVADMLTVATYVGVRQGPRFAAFYGCMFYGLMRPAEVARLTKAGCYLPERGWGALTFGDSAPAPGREWTNSGDVHEERGLKGRSRKAVRKVPIPPELVHLLCEHVERFGTAPDGRLFRSERGGVIQPSTWWQVWRKVRSLSLTPDQLVTPLMRRPYDLRAYPDLRWLRCRPGRGVDRSDECRSSPRQADQRGRKRGSAVTGWGASGVQGPADHGLRWRFLAGARTATGCRSCWS